jgi:hypothetical protein
LPHDDTSHFILFDLQLTADRVRMRYGLYVSRDQPGATPQ